MDGVGQMVVDGGVGGWMGLIRWWYGGWMHGGWKDGEMGGGMIVA